MGKEKIACILGTGFSKAIYNEMPLLLELDKTVVEKINDSSRQGYNEEYKIIYEKYIIKKNIYNFEDILTYIYSNLPWKTEEEYNLLKALYYYISNILVEIFLEKGSKYREMLKRSIVDKEEDLKVISNFIYYLHSQEANVITFNYDNIFELFAINILGLKSLHRIVPFEDSHIQTFEFIDCINDDSKKYPADIEIDKDRKLMKFFYRNMHFIEDHHFFQKFFDKNFKEKFGEEYRSAFARAFMEFHIRGFNSELAISAEDIYRIPLIRIRERGGSTNIGLRNISYANRDFDYLKSTLRFYKLHGSINWYYNPNEIGTSQIYIKSGSKVVEKIEEHWMQDLQPIIIPPLLDKSSYMSINSLKILWDSAKNSIKEAEKIFIIGYSLPESDLTVKLLLKNYINDNTQIYIVDINRYIKQDSESIKNYDNIENRFKKLFKPQNDIIEAEES